jgi:hypothetical protein
MSGECGVCTDAQPCVMVQPGVMVQPCEVQPCEVQPCEVQPCEVQPCEVQPSESICATRLHQSHYHTMGSLISVSVSQICGVF